MTIMCFDQYKLGLFGLDYYKGYASNIFDVYKLVQTPLFSVQNLSLASSYLSSGCLGKIGLNWALIGSITNGDRFKSIYESYLLSCILVCIEF